MRNLRALFCVALVCSICLGLCGQSYALDLWTVDEIEEQVQSDLDALISSETELEGSLEEQDVEQEQENMSISLFSSDMASASLGIAGETVTMYWSNYIRYGFRQALYTYAAGEHTATFPTVNTYDYTYTTLASVTGSSASTITNGGAYVYLPNDTYVDISFDVNYYYKDYSYVDFIGSFNSYFYVRNRVGTDSATANAAYYYPYTFGLVINGEEVATSSTGEFNYRQVLDRDTPELSNYTIRAYYSAGTSSILNSNGSNATQLDFIYCLKDNIAFEVEETQRSWWQNLFRWLQEIVDGISNVGTLIRNVVSAITSLPQKIIDLLIDALKSLFIPSESDLTAIKDRYDSLMEEKLGFVYQTVELMTNTIGGIVDAFTSGAEYTFEFPEISFPTPKDGTVVIVQAQTVSFDNGVFSLLRPICGTAVSIVCVIAFLNTAYGMFMAFVSGVSWWEFVKGKGNDMRHLL